MPATLVLRGGRVIDPGAMRDEIADVHIEGGRISAVGQELIVPRDALVFDVAGRVVGPGFVDLHSHVHSIAGQRLQALDGVTTSLDLESGLMPVQLAIDKALSAGRPLNFGFSASWASARAQVLTGVVPDAEFESGLSVLGDAAWQRSSTPRELSRWLGLLGEELEAGALGIGVLLGYAPRSDPLEFVAVARLAAETGAPTFTHVRELVEADPTTPVDGSEEVARAAAMTGAHMHHCHVNSTSRRHVDRVLAMLERARAEGAPVSVETYPYGAGSTAIGAYFLAPERLGAWGIEPGNLIMLSSGEPVGSERELEELRARDPGAPCIVEFLDERTPEDAALLVRALAFPDSIVASDAMPIYWPDGRTDSLLWPLPPGGSTHPRTAGTFAKSLRLMVRERACWSWLEAFRRCSYLPARVLDGVSPGARNKGHLGPGADADVVVLDPDRITDMATYLDPTRPSLGVTALLVNGSFVVRDGTLCTEVFPGAPLRGFMR